MSTAGTPSWWRVGLAGRCPHCTNASIFDGYLSIRDECPACEFPLGLHDNGDGPAFLIICILSTVLVPIAILVSLIIEMPFWLMTVIWGAIILGASIGMLRPAKGLMMALQYKNDGAGADWAAQREMLREIGHLPQNSSGTDQPGNKSFADTLADQNSKATPP